MLEILLHELTKKEKIDTSKKKKKITFPDKRNIIKLFPINNNQLYTPALL